MHSVYVHTDLYKKNTQLGTSIDSIEVATLQATAEVRIFWRYDLSKLQINDALK